jgi:Leucine-rich repeat (LRR) protein
LDSNKIAILPHGLFDGLVSMTSLNVSGNQIKLLPNKIFDKLVKLQQLTFKINEITYLPPGIFDNLPDSLLVHIDESLADRYKISTFSRVAQSSKQLINNQLVVLGDDIDDEGDIEIIEEKSSKRKKDEMGAVDEEDDIQRAKKMKQSLERYGECVICLSSTKTHTTVPCGHFVCCEKCSVDLSRSKVCPICRKPISSLMKIFF